MKIPRKSATVSKKLTDEIVQNSNRWTQFIIHSGVRFEDLSDEWLSVFDAQADVDSSTGDNLVRLVDKAIQADLENNK